MPRTKRQRTTRITRKKRGGKFIASGSYGCVYKPSLPCNTNAFRNRESANYVTKLMNRSSAESEDSKGRIVRSAFSTGQKQSNNYILTPAAICGVPTLSANQESEIQKCDVYSKFKEPYLLQMKNGGVDLHKFRCPPEDIYNFMKSLLNLVEGLQFLHDHNIAHLDIKPANIVTERLDSGLYHTRFVDVGFVMDINKYSQYPDKAVFRGPYVIWPYEARYLSVGNVIHTPRKELIEEFYEYAVEELQRYHVPNEAYYESDGTPVFFDDKFRMDFVAFYKQGSNGVNVKKVAKAVDVYSLGYAFAIIFARTFHKNLDDPVNMVDDEDRTFYLNVVEPMLEIVTSMMSPYPSKRATLVEVEKKFTAFLENLKLIDFTN